jgi:hypothetical protein
MVKRMMTLTVILAAAVILAAGCGGRDPDPLDEVRVESTRQAVALEATRTALDLEREAFELERSRARADSVDVFLMALPWVVLGVGLLACAVVAWQMLPILTARLGLVRRKPEEGEPVWLLGKNRLALPLRSANSYQDLTQGRERAPLLAESAEAQERATLRQQAVNLALGQQAAKTVEARTGRGAGTVIMLPDGEPARAETPTLPAPSPVRVVEPGEVKAWLGDVEPRLLTEVIDDGD